jgi:hypothetical protein
MTRYILLRIALSYSGLLVWPVFQLFHRRWSWCAKRLLLVFLVDLGCLAIITGILELTGTAHYWVPGAWLYPFINMLSLAVSGIFLGFFLNERRRNLPDRTDIGSSQGDEGNT